MKKKTSTLLALSLSLGLLTTNNLEVFASELDEDSEESIVHETDLEDKLEEVEDEEKTEKATEEVADEEESQNSEDEEKAVDSESQELESEEEPEEATEGESQELQESEEELKDGWVEEDGGIFYYENGEKTTGWKKISNDWYYFDESGFMQGEGTLEINGKTYRFTESGKMVTGWYDDGGYGYEWDDTLGDYVETWISDWQYYHTSGSMATGWTKVENDWYYFDDWGSMQGEGQVEINGKTYRFRASGKMVTGWYDDGYYGDEWDDTIDDYVETWISDWQYYHASGSMATGWTKVNNSWHYFDDWGSMQSEGQVEINGKTYRFRASGKMVTGWYDDGYYDYEWDDTLGDDVKVWVSDWQYYHLSGSMATGWTKVKNKWYYLDEYGSMVTGTITIGHRDNTFSSKGVWEGSWEENSKGIWFKDANGKYPKNQWSRLDGIWYHFDKNGYVNTGWEKINNKWYYFNDLGEMIHDTIYDINDKYYRFNKSGVMVTGWHDDGYYDEIWDENLEESVRVWVNNWHYYHTSGSMASGWTKVKNKWYYFSDWGEMHADTKSWIKGKAYFFDKAGAMRTQGWHNAGGYEEEWNEETEKVEKVWIDDWYYISKSGAASTGWTKVNNKWYYFEDYGSMVTGEKRINRKTNVFSASGSWEGTWEENSKGIWFKDANGKYPKNQWRRLDASWYNFDKNGYVNTGWKKIDNKWYYFDELGRMNDVEIREIKGKEYRFNKSGSLYTGWYDAGYYYWDWEEEKDIWVSDWKYYTVNGAVTNAWKKTDNKWYYFDDYGSMVTGKEYIDGAWHEFAADGAWIGKLDY